MPDSDSQQSRWEPASASETLGIIDEERGEGWARARMPIRQHHLRRPTPDSGVQGGMIVALADHAFTFASFTVVAPGQTFATVELKVNFIAQANEGELIATGRIIHRGKRTLIGEIEVTDGQG